MAAEAGELRRQAMELLACEEELKRQLSQIGLVRDSLERGIDGGEAAYLLEALDQLRKELLKEAKACAELAELIPEVGAQLRAETEILNQDLLDSGGGLF